MDIEKIIREYLPQLMHMSLATAQNNKPWVCEVHFATDDDLNIYFRSLALRRHSQEIAHNAQVAGNIVKQHALGEPPLGVYFEGTAKKLAAGEELDKAFACFKAKFAASETLLEEAQRPDGHQFYKITVSTYYVFGKLDDERAKKYELHWQRGQS